MHLLPLRRQPITYSLPQCLSGLPHNTLGEIGPTTDPEIADIPALNETSSLYDGMLDSVPFAAMS